MATQKTVIISGASSGIGLAAAIIFASHGWKTYAGVRTPSKRQAIIDAATAKNLGRFLEPLELDVTQDASVKQAVAHVLKQSGRIDVLVNNAAYGVFGPVEGTTVDQYAKQYDTNVLGTVRLIQEVLPHLRAQKAGRIINISSLLGSVAFGYLSAYSATKWALEAISQSLYDEVAPLGIRVSIVQPSFTKTAFVIEKGQRDVQEPVYEQGIEQRTKATKAGLENGDTAEVVGQVIFDAATDAEPKFRYQATQVGTAIIASVLKDPSGINLGLAAGK